MSENQQAPQTLEGKRVMLLGCYNVGNLFGHVTHDDGARLSLIMEDGGHKLTRYVPVEVVAEVPRSPEWVERLKQLKAEMGIID